MMRNVSVEQWTAFETDHGIYEALGKSRGFRAEIETVAGEERLGDDFRKS